MSEFLHRFIVLTSAQFAAPRATNVSQGAVGYVEGIHSGGMAEVRFSGDRTLHLDDCHMRLATAAEVAANDTDFDHDDVANADEGAINIIGDILNGIDGSPVGLNEYISAAKIRAHGELSCDETDIRRMVERIRRDHREDGDHFAKVAAEEEEGDRMTGDRFE